MYIIYVYAWIATYNVCLEIDAYPSFDKYRIDLHFFNFFSFLSNSSLIDYLDDLLGKSPLTIDKETRFSLSFSLSFVYLIRQKFNLIFVVFKLNSIAITLSLEVWTADCWKNSLFFYILLGTLFCWNRIYVLVTFDLQIIYRTAAKNRWTV